jgi:hypothetical protein
MVGFKFWYLLGIINVLNLPVLLLWMTCSARDPSMSVPALEVVLPVACRPAARQLRNKHLYNSNC